MQRLQKENSRELKRLNADHRIAIRQLKIRQNQAVSAERAAYRANNKFSSNNGSSKGSSAHSSQPMSRMEAESDCSSMTSLGHQSMNSGSAGVPDEIDDDNDDSSVIKSTKTTSKALVNMIKRHAAELENLRKFNLQELNDFETNQESRLADLFEKHQMESHILLTSQQQEIEETKVTQEKEILMEEAMHDAEMKALIERKILGTVLDTVDDGIINITTTGILMRFNQAAETIFGYTAEEVIGKNVKILMTDEYASLHDAILSNYMTTGIKKVIGLPNGRRVTGKRKNGQVFPLQLSVSELKTDESHMFTGIARDLTEEVALEEINEAKAKAKKEEMEKLISQLDKSNAKADGLLSQLLPPLISKRLMAGQPVVPESFSEATIFFLDIVGFTTISQGIPPLDVVSLLNGIYNMFDSVIEQYDAYKVETIGISII